MALESIDHIAHIDTYNGFQCEHCGKSVGGDLHGFDESVNHYIADHAYKLLHIGQETATDTDGNIWQKTVAVVGKDKL